MYHQKKDFISEPCEPKDSEYLKKFKLLIQIEFVEVSVIIPVDETNLLQAATIHSVSWNGTKIYLLIIDNKPIGIVSITNSLIEDLYVLPDLQNMGYGTKLLQYAIDQCADTPTLWILENNTRAEKLYRRMGFKKTGKKNSITDGLDEIEYALF